MSQTLTILVLVAAMTLMLICQPGLADEPAETVTLDPARCPKSIQDILRATSPLGHPRGGRLPLLLWPALRGQVDDDALQEAILRELDRRGVAVMATWNYNRKDDSLAQAVRLARLQKKLGLEVIVNATPSLYRFFNRTKETAHVDADGKTFFDDSFGKGKKMGCPFAVDHRYEAMRERIAFFVRAYNEKDLPLTLVWGDWEVDGPIEWNHAWQASKRCTRCRQTIPDIEDFAAFQKALRLKRAEMTHRCYAEPILQAYPDCLVGNYGVYPHDGLRYWYDYFEYFAEHYPHVTDQRARYRKWFPEFERTGYTFAMPVVYTWQEIFGWYDFQPTDYRWVYNMLKVGSNAAQHTPADVPVIPFVHHGVIEVGTRPSQKPVPLSVESYREVLWHLLLRGHDTFFTWNRPEDDVRETRPVWEVYNASLQYADFLHNGTPLWFDVPDQPGAVVSAIRLGSKLLVRRSDFGPGPHATITRNVDGQRIAIPSAPGRCIVIELKHKPNQR